MKIKGIILLSSIVTATLLISGGYGYWQKELQIEGDIAIVKPDPIISIPLIEQPLSPGPNVEQTDNVIGVYPSPDNQSEEQLPDATESIETIPQEPEQLERDENSDKTELIEQVEESEQPHESEEFKETEQSGSNKQATEEQTPLNDDNESSKSLESPPIGDKETLSPEDNVGDENDATN